MARSPVAGPRSICPALRQRPECQQLPKWLAGVRAFPRLTPPAQNGPARSPGAHPRRPPLSISSYRSTVERLGREQAAAQTRVAQDTAKVTKLRADAARLRSEALRTTNASMHASKRRSAESKERDLSTAERRLGESMARRADIDRKVGAAADRLHKAEATEQARLDRESKKRQAAEKAHLRAMTPSGGRQLAKQGLAQVAGIGFGAAPPPSRRSRSSGVRGDPRGRTSSGAERR